MSAPAGDPPVEAELRIGVRAARDFEPFTAVLRRTFGWVPALSDPWRHVATLQRELIKIGQQTMDCHVV